MHPKVSIIVPVYNVEKYIGACLESLANQTLKEIEVIIINDGSKDDSVQIAQKYVDKYNNFSIYHKENGGAGDARNYGVGIASGEYITFLDSDDMLTQNACELLYEKAKQSNSDIVIGKPVWKRLDGTEEAVEYLAYWFEGDLSRNFKENSKIAIGFPVATSKLFLSSLIKDNNIVFPKIIGEDVVFSVLTYHYSNKITIINNVIYLRTDRNDYNNKSITQIFNSKAVKDRLYGVNLISDFCKKNNLKEIQEQNLCQVLSINNILLRITDQADKQNAFNIFNEFLLSMKYSDEKDCVSKILNIDCDKIIGMTLNDYETHPANKFEYIRSRELKKLKSWTKELESTKIWLEGQLENYKNEVNNQDNVISELKNWNAELQSGKRWLEEQLKNYKLEVERQNEIIKQLNM